MLLFSVVCLGLGAVLVLVSGVAIVLEKASLGSADIGGYYGKSRGELTPAVLAQLKEQGRPRLAQAALGSLIGLDLVMVGLGCVAILWSDGHWLAWIVALGLWLAAAIQLVAWFRATR